MANQDINVLTGLKTAKVSLVKRGANRQPRFPIHKSETDMPGLQDILAPVLGVEAENEANLSTVCKGLSEKGEAAMLGALRVISAYKDELPKDAIAKLGELSGMPVKKADENPFAPDPDKEKKDAAKKAEEEEAKKKAAKEAAAKIAKADGAVAKALAGMDPELATQMEPVLKAMGDAQTEAIAKADARADAAESKTSTLGEILKSERDTRQLKEWVGKAATDLSHYPLKSSAELGQMLKDLHDHNPTMANEQFEVMKAASTAIKKSALLQPAGSGGALHEDGSVMDRVSKLVASAVQKSDGGLTAEAAEVAIFKADPDLYNEYLAENPNQTGSRG